jgi:hypothetical protein
MNRTFTSSIKLAYNVSCFESEAWDMASKPAAQSELKIESDGWAQFERAADAVVKGGPQHRIAIGGLVSPKRSQRQLSAGDRPKEEQLREE